MRTRLRSKVTLLFMTFGLLLAIPAVALANDQLQDELTSTPATATITQNDPNGFTNDYYVKAIGGSPPSCDISASSPRTFQINVPAGVVATPDTLTFDACGDANTNTQSVKFTSSTANNTTGYAITATETPDVTGPLSVSTENASFTLFVDPAPSDTTGPSITITTPPDGATYLVNEEVLAAYACSDPSGVETCVGNVADGQPISTSPVTTTTTGPKSFTVNATDTLDNESSLTHKYNVRAYDFVGFSSPVDNMPTLNKAKAGQAIPLKWRLMDNGSPVTNLESVKVTVQNLSCSRNVTADLLEEYAAGSSSLQNLGDGYYQFNWKSPKDYANSCKTLTVNGLGVQSQANFEFTK
jgi:hypothetical protein